MELDLCKLLGDDFLENLQEDVASEGSNGSSTTSDTRAMPRNHGSNSSLCASGSGSLANNFASAFDLDMDELPASAASPDWAQGGSGHVPPSKAGSADLNNLVSSSSPTKATRSARTAAREAAAAAKAAKEEVTTAPTKITLKVKGGVQKPAGGAKASRATAAACAAATGAPAAAPAAQGGPAQEECPLSAADLSRLLGEDDNRIPDGWDLDLDFENPFSCSITAF
ncbi:hypothetical protein HYH03_002486 [Edaphochlamys debaryana]|uniref:Uncharacterized protein n=1 Tax=Edaphochlamys debaryana TaxID=47281 RepID=A0A836C467_9CHLO|nr:hypothetical protein HYH03_002486 [Edaphochlamys debaryana]|eukprot:KAG2499540.1 hypothetical protein HYH03_002486 [Edaphochlamys debaryana]